MMTKSGLNYAVFWLYALVSIVVSAQEDDAAYAAVNSALEQATGHAAIIQTLTRSPHDMNLAEATVFAMVSGGDANRIDFVEAGVSSAGNLPQAQSVVNAVRAAAGQFSPEAAAAERAFEAFVRLMPQPGVFQDDYEPAGGSLRQVETLPGGPGNPPVSPSS